MTFDAPLPDRKPHNLMHELRWRTIPGGRITYFKMYDNRTFKAVHREQNVFNNQSMLQITTEGCIECFFLVNKFKAADKLTLKFCNMPVQLYEVLTRAAVGTTSHPMSWKYCFYKVAIFTEGRGVETKSLPGIMNTATGDIKNIPSGDELYSVLRSIHYGPCFTRVSHDQLPTGFRAVNISDYLSFTDSEKSKIEAAANSPIFLYSPGWANLDVPVEGKHNRMINLKD